MAVINPGTSLADNVCVNTSASVDHDNTLERSSHIFPNATLAGGVTVGECSQIGSGAVVNPNLRIGRHSYVGAGAVVTRDVAEGVVVVGVPAREIKKQTRRQD
jgi:acetyltransferase-like isoleucine patch superfamily enzyme